MSAKHSSLIANTMIVVGFASVIFGIIYLLVDIVPDTTPPLAPTNLHALDIARTCESFNRLDKETRCNEHIVECKNSKGEVVFLNAAC